MDALREEWPLVAVVASTVALAWYLSRPRRREIQLDPENLLLRSCLGDLDLVERLVAHEMEIRPGINRKEAALRALDSLRRDGAAPRIKGLEEVPHSKRPWWRRLWASPDRDGQSLLRLYLVVAIQVTLFVLVVYWVAHILGGVAEPGRSGTP